MMFRAVRGRVIPARRRVPAPLAGRWAGRETTRVGARPRGGPKPAPGRPVSAIAHGVSPPDHKAATCRSRRCGSLRDADALGETGLAVFAGQQGRAAGPHLLGKLSNPRRTEAGTMAHQ